MTDTTPLTDPPAHGGQTRQIAQRFGIPASKLLDFSANLHPGGPPPQVFEALRHTLSNPDILRDYPDLDLPDLRSSLAPYAGVGPSNILIANGMAPLLDAVLRALRIRKCLLPVPAFAEYRKTLALCGVTVDPFVLSPERDFALEPRTILDTLVSQQCDALLLANPQNPSGVLLPAQELLELVNAAQECGVRVLLDEAFIEYAQQESLTAHAQSIPNLTVFRSVTKFFALAGMRIAYAVAPEDVCKRVNSFIPSWPVSSMAAIAVCSVLQDTKYRQHAVLENESERHRLHAELVSVGLKVYPGRANYLLFRIPLGLKSAVVWEELIARHGIVVRNCDNFHGLDDRFLRVAVRTPEDNARLVAALQSVMKT